MTQQAQALTSAEIGQRIEELEQEQTAHAAELAGLKGQLADGEAAQQVHKAAAARNPSAATMRAVMEGEAVKNAIADELSLHTAALQAIADDLKVAHNELRAAQALELAAEVESIHQQMLEAATRADAAIADLAAAVGELKQLRKAGEQLGARYPRPVAEGLKDVLHIRAFGEEWRLAANPELATLAGALGIL